jgi:very-short-patch-repair endonuclease
MIRSTKKLTKEEFIKKAIAVHNNKFNYSLVEYVGNKSKIIIVCSKHGEFTQRPNDHLSGYGCKKCQYEKTSKENKFTDEIFVEKAKQIHGTKFDYSLVKYGGYENKIIIICKKHGIFEQTPHAHLCGIGCPSCKESQGERKVAEVLTKNNIQFERQVTFNDLKDKSNLFYDFYLPEHKLFIEFDGIQHYKPVSFFGGENAFELRKKHDLIKYKYAVNNKYKILKIRFIPPKYLEEAFVNKLKEISIL